MLPLRQHLSNLAELVFAADQERSSEKWLGVSENLRIVTALEDISTGTPPGQPSLCGAVDDSNDGFNDMTRLRVAGMVAFTLTWQAYESAVYVHDPKTKAAGARGRDLLKAIGADRPIPLLDELLTEARDTFAECMQDASEIEHEKIDELLGDGLVPAAAAECVRQFRNGIIHGWLPTPIAGLASEDDGSMPEEPGIVVFGQMTRLTGILIQILFSMSFKADDFIEYATDEYPAHELLDSFHVAPPQDLEQSARRFILGSELR